MKGVFPSCLQGNGVVNIRYSGDNSTHSTHAFTLRSISKSKYNIACISKH